MNVLDHLVQWNVGATSKKFYFYDASGQRVLKRSISDSSTTLTSYILGLEDYRRCIHAI